VRDYDLIDAPGLHFRDQEFGGLGVIGNLGSWMVQACSAPLTTGAFDGAAEVPLASAAAAVEVRISRRVIIEGSNIYPIEEEYSWNRERNASRGVRCGKRQA
jgi:hypothetical protein